MKANEIIKARRTDLGMTQKELAVKVDPMALKAVSAFQQTFQVK